MTFQHRALPASSLLLAGTFATGARAAEAADAPSAVPIVVSCPADRAPSMRDVERLLGTTTFQSTANARARVGHLVRQACGRGALAVRVLAGTQPETSFVQRDALDIARGLPVR